MELENFWKGWWGGIIFTLIAGVVTYLFMSTHLDRREVKCKEHCLANGNSSYVYEMLLRGRGGRAEFDICTCVK